MLWRSAASWISSQARDLIARQALAVAPWQPAMPSRQLRLRSCSARLMKESVSPRVYNLGTGNALTKRSLCSPRSCRLAK